jgi:hypothetical protein
MQWDCRLSTPPSLNWLSECVYVLDFCSTSLDCRPVAHRGTDCACVVCMCYHRKSGNLSLGTVSWQTDSCEYTRLFAVCGIHTKKKISSLSTIYSTFVPFKKILCTFVQFKIHHVWAKYRYLYNIFFNFRSAKPIYSESLRAVVAWSYCS